MSSTSTSGICGVVPASVVAWLELDIVPWQRRQIVAAGGDPSAIPDPVAPRFLRRREVQARTGLSCSTIYRFMAQGKFPHAIAIDGRRRGGGTLTMARNYAKVQNRRPHGERFARLPEELLKSEAVRTLPHAAFKLMTLMAVGARPPASVDRRDGGKNGTQAITDSYARRYGVIDCDIQCHRCCFASSRSAGASRRHRDLSRQLMPERRRGVIIVGASAMRDPRMASRKSCPEAEAYLRGALARAQQELPEFDNAVANQKLGFWSYTAGGRSVNVTHDQRARHEAIIAEIRRVLGA